MNAGKLLLHYLWRIAFCAFIFAVGLVVSRLVLHAVGLTPPRMPQQADESTAIYYLLTGSIILSIGLFPLAQQICGTFLTRFSVMFLFFFACFGISDSLESSIYSSIEGFDLMMIVLFLPMLLFSLASTGLTSSRSPTEPFLQKSKRFFRSKTPSEWAWRIFLTVLSFPFVYLLFGIIASPLVADYYGEGSYGLTLPGFGTIMAVQLVRSLLFLFVTLPLMIVWSGKMMQLVLTLGIAHFVIVFSYDIVLAYQLPMTLVLTHGVEILLDSLVYSWILVKLMRSEQTRVK